MKQKVSNLLCAAALIFFYSLATASEVTIGLPKYQPPFLNESVAATPIQVKAGNTIVYGYTIVNRDATNAIYVHYYNGLVADITLGTTTQADLTPVPANGSVFVPVTGAVQKLFTAGLTIAITTSPLSSGTTAPGTPAVVSIIYN